MCWYFLYRCFGQRQGLQHYQSCLFCLNININCWPYFYLRCWRCCHNLSIGRRWLVNGCIIRTQKKIIFNSNNSTSSKDYLVTVKDGFCIHLCWYLVSSVHCWCLAARILNSISGPFGCFLFPWFFWFFHGICGPTDGVSVAGHWWKQFHCSHFQ